MLLGGAAAWSAVAGAQTRCYGNWASDTFNLGTFASPAAACAAIVALPGYGGHYAVSGVVVTNGQALCQFTSSDGYPPQSQGVSGSVVACPISCSQVASDLNGQPSATQRGYSAFQSSATCTNVIQQGTCLLEGSFSARLNPSSPWIAYGPFREFTGSCGTASTPTTPTLPAQLPAGMCPGTVNGQAVTVPCGEASSGPASSTTTNGSGATTGSTSTTTSCDAQSCTTTTTSRDAGGGITNTSSTTTSRTDYCGANASSGACRGTGSINGPGTGSSGTGTGSGGAGDASFGGSCAEGFTCEGDAVQCAIARDQHRRHCQMFDLDNALSDIGTPAMKGEAQPQGHPGAQPDAQTFDFSQRIDRTDRLSGGCPGDMSIAVAGNTVALPLSGMCSSLVMLGNIMVGICMLAALGIVFR